MIIAIWVIAIIGLIIISGELRYRYSAKEKFLGLDKVFLVDWKESIDADMCDLSMEGSAGDYVSSRRLAMRGSWRLAQSQVLEKSSFEKLREIEYGKML